MNRWHAACRWPPLASGAWREDHPAYIAQHHVLRM